MEMNMQYEGNEFLQLIGAVCHPTRYKILQFLKAEGRSFYINEIADAIEKERRLVSFHLSTLEKHRLVSSSFAMIKAPTSKGVGKAGRFYKITDRGNTFYEAFTDMMTRLVEPPIEK